jgi:hypothetical protein
MAERPSSAPTPTLPTPTGKQALLEAAQEVVRKQAEDRKAELDAERRARSRISPLVAMGSAILLVMVAYIAVERPTWLFPHPPVPESAEVQEASLRIGMAAVAQRVERFREQRRRLPRTLAEAGSAAEHIRYERLDSLSYRLQGTRGPLTLTYRSSDSLRIFVGASFEAIARRSGR